MTKQEQFNYFKKECLKWQNIFGLTGWRIDFIVEDLKDRVAADCAIDYFNRVITLRLNKKVVFSKDALKEHALHEMLHALLGRLNIISGSRWVQKDEWDEEEHNVVRKLEKLLKK